jgi:Holliday junction resolvasome RuvABC endonuclease subunit
MSQYVIAIDPSINNCGLAVFKNKELKRYELLHPTVKKKSHYLEKARSMAQKIEEVYDYYEDRGRTKLVTEIPQHFGASERGFLSRESGSMLKLSFLAGMIYNIAPDTITYEPNEWKGQLPKCVVRNRLLRPYPDIKLFGKKEIHCPDCKRSHKIHDLDHNIVDAIAIGHFHIWRKI